MGRFTQRQNPCKMLFFNMETGTVQSLGDLVRAVTTLAKETKLSWWYRGHINAKWDLLPAARRGYTKKQERHLSNEFYVRARTRYNRCPPQEDYAGWLALMQQYGLPTRLLDWTSSPLIAAFFATQVPDRHNDACVWALAPEQFNEAQGYEPLLYPLNAEQLHDLLKPALKGEDKHEKIIAARAIEMDPRMQVQQGAFTVHASEVPLNHLPGCDGWLRRFVIPAKAATTVAWELEVVGFRLGDLFPDLGNLAAELRARQAPEE